MRVQFEQVVVHAAIFALEEARYRIGEGGMR
jgi:hypothetical protein